MKKILMVLALTGLLCSCGGSDLTLTRQKLSEIYGNVADYMDDVSSGNHKMASLKRIYQEEEDTSTLASVVAFVKWSSNLYANETFLVTDEIVEFRIQIGNNNVGICWLNEADRENDKLYGTFLVSNDGEIDPESTLVMHFDVDYDFQIDEIKSFEIIQIFWGEDILNLCFKYDGSKFYILDYADESEETIAVREKGSSVKAKIAEKIESRIFLEEDYSQEYFDAMTYAGA